MEGGATDATLEWRNQLALRLLRGFGAVFALSIPLVLWTLHGTRAYVIASLTFAAAVLVGVPALTGRPSGPARGWLIIVPALTMSVSGYAFVGFLSGPGVCLTISLMLSGLLLGRRAMIGLAVGSGVVVALIGWAMVHRFIPAPNPEDVAMTQALPWVRSLGVTLFAISLFGGMMIAVVDRMERALRAEQSETKRREQAERERAEAERVALEAKQLETIGRLAAGIAHDFNNNLTAIIGCAELLKLELENNAEALELSDSILQSSQRAAELTRQLLAYSRKAQMLRTPTDLHALVGEVVSLVRRSTTHGVELHTELRAERHTVAADSSLLQSALLNLLVNARDAMPEGGQIQITTRSVTTQLTPEADHVPCVLLRVQDNGRGIPEELLPRIFDPFFTTKPVGKGTGLGLAAVAGTVKAHGGRIDVDSKVDAGTTFQIYLPCVEPELRESAPAAPASRTGEGELLLVEDDVMVASTAVTTLQSFGYRVTHAADGERALEAVRRNPARFQLVLLDLRMPGLSGEATFEALQKLAPSLPVLIWSGYAAEQDVESMLRRGAVGFVRKPYRVAELSRTIAEAIRAPREPSAGRA